MSEEIKKHREEALIKSGLVEVEFDLALALVFSKINFVSFSEFEGLISSAKEVCPDPDDVEYLALALRLGCAVWSDDKRLKKQELVKIISTSELLELLKFRL